MHAIELIIAGWFTFVAIGIIWWSWYSKRGNPDIQWDDDPYSPPVVYLKAKDVVPPPGFKAWED